MAVEQPAARARGAAQRQHRGGAFGRRAAGRSTRARSASSGPCGKRADAAPQLGADRPACGPALVRVVAQHARQRRIGAPRRGRRSASSGLPTNSAFSTIWFQASSVELLGRVGVAVRDGLEHHLHVRAHAFGGAQRGGAVHRGRAAGRGRRRPARRRRRWRTARRAGARRCRHRRRRPAAAAMRAAWSSGPVRRVPAGPRLRGHGQFGGARAPAAPCPACAQPG